MMESQFREVIHIDDDPQFTAVTAQQLSKRGFKVISITDPHKAMGVLTSRQTRVVLLDVDLPGLSGLDLLKKIKQHDSNVLVVVLTGVASQGAVTQMLRYGAEACLFKPTHSADTVAAAMDDAFRKIDRWWGTLKQLADLRHKRYVGKLPTTRVAALNV